MKLIKLLILFSISSCTLIPSKEWIISDFLDENLTINDIGGTYIPTEKTLEKLQDFYSMDQMDSIEDSYIIINPTDTIIIGKYIPGPKYLGDFRYTGEYIITSGKKRLSVRGWKHDKFRFISRPDKLQYPYLYFRMFWGQKSILVNLDYDPDSYDYYEYILKEK